MRERARSWLEAYRGFDLDALTPIILAVCFFFVLIRDEGYVSLALGIFMFIYLELRRMRKQWRNIEVTMRLPTKEAE